MVKQEESPKEFKAADKSLEELGDQLVGYRGILDTLALNYGRTHVAFWKRARELYPEVDFERYNFDHADKTFRRK